MTFDPGRRVGPLQRYVAILSLLTMTGLSLAPTVAAPVGPRIVSVDVTGNLRVPTQTIMSVVQASLRVISSERNISLPELAGRMNSFLYRSTPSNSYATFFFAQIDEISGRMNYVNAGHNPPLLVRSPEIVELAASGTVLGLFPGMIFQEDSIDLRAGDVFVAFTDGVPEALNPENADAQFLLGQSLAKLGRTAEAIEHWKHALRIDPNQSQAMYSLARNLDRARDPEAPRYQHQLQEFEEREQLTDRIELLRSFALQAGKAGNWPQAIEQLQQAIQLCKACKDAALLHKNLAFFYEKTGRINEAESELEKTLAIDPQDTKAQLALEQLRSVLASAP